jgi:hypothetical protein
VFEFVFDVLGSNMFLFSSHLSFHHLIIFHSLLAHTLTQSRPMPTAQVECVGILAASDPSFVVRHCSASLCATLDRLGAETNGFADIEVCECCFGLVTMLVIELVGGRSVDDSPIQSTGRLLQTRASICYSHNLCLSPQLRSCERDISSGCF